MPLAVTTMHLKALSTNQGPNASATLATSDSVIVNARSVALNPDSEVNEVTESVGEDSQSRGLPVVGEVAVCVPVVLLVPEGLVPEGLVATVGSVTPGLGFSGTVINASPVTQPVINPKK